MTSRSARTIPVRQRLPWRFGLFLILCVGAIPLGAVYPLHYALMASFDGAALAFLVSLIPLFGHGEAGMRAHARANDVNRGAMLLVTAIVTTVVLVVVAAELSQRRSQPSPGAVALILSTLALAWTFANTVYALHYAYLFYSGDEAGKDRGGIGFPGEGTPDYWDFLYFAFTLGMTFQTSDVDITSRAVRKTVIFHCALAFFFNLGVIAFTINVLGAG